MLDGLVICARKGSPLLNELGWAPSKTSIAAQSISHYGQKGLTSFKRQQRVVHLKDCELLDIADEPVVKLTAFRDAGEKYAALNCAARTIAEHQDATVSHRVW